MTRGDWIWLVLALACAALGIALDWAGYQTGARLLGGVIGGLAGLMLARLAARSSRPFLRGAELFGLMFLPALVLAVLLLAIAGLRDLAGPLIVGFFASVAAAAVGNNNAGTDGSSR